MKLLNEKKYIHEIYISDPVDNILDIIHYSSFDLESDGQFSITLPNNNTILYNYLKKVNTGCLYKKDYSFSILIFIYGDDNEDINTIGLYGCYVSELNISSCDTIYEYIIQFDYRNINVGVSHYLTRSYMREKNIDKILNK